MTLRTLRHYLDIRERPPKVHRRRIRRHNRHIIPASRRLHATRPRVHRRRLLAIPVLHSRFLPDIRVDLAANRRLAVSELAHTPYHVVRHGHPLLQELRGEGGIHFREETLLLVVVAVGVFGDVIHLVFL